MAAVAPTSTPFSDWLRSELHARGWGIRTLATKIDPERPEVPRRALNHYMRGSLPTERYAVAIAEAFGISREDVPVEEAAVPTGASPFRRRPRADAPAADRAGGREGADRGVTEDAA